MLGLALFAVVLFGSWLFRQMRSLPAASALAARADQRIVTLEVGGMTCSNCAATIQARLSSVPGVSNVAVRYPQHRAYVVCDAAVRDTALTGAIGRAGPGFLAAITPR